MTLSIGDAYVEQGATATDETDGDVNVTISGTVDTSSVGTYTITYAATDSAGNTASATRTVKVADNSETTVINDDFTIDLSQIDDYHANDPIEDQYLAVINYLRSLHIKCNDASGLEGPVGIDLIRNTFLENSAKEHSDDMLATGQFAHDGSGTQNDITGQTFTPARASTPFERMVHNGYNYSLAGENIAYRAAYPELASDAWVRAIEDLMKSHSGHCSNIMNPNFRDFGMAEARGVESIQFSDGVTREVPTAYWTQNFGAQ